MGNVEQTLATWTEGLDEREKRMRVFDRVRDMPYAVIPDIRNCIDGPRQLLERGCGSCTPKHFLLGRMFELLGIDVAYVTFPFSWKQPQLKLNPMLDLLADALPTEYHLALQAAIDGKHVLVDATWDAPLARHGFPVNLSWDGSSEMRVAVDYKDMIVHDTAEERDAYVAEAKSSWRHEDYQREAAFIKELNAWLQGLREA